METNTVSKILKIAGICPEGIEWMEQQPSPKDAWFTCTNGDWLLSAVSLMNIPSPDQWDAIMADTTTQNRADVVRQHIPWRQIEALFITFERLYNANRRPH